MKHLDLFSGIGGFALAARWAEIETIQFVEVDKFCQKVLKKHWPHIPLHDYVETFKSPFTNIITAGFPCQPFSVAGKRKGISDERYLWPEVFRVIKESRADWIILENVPGIIPYIDHIFEDLEREGYAWTSYLIPASAVGAPHKRERLWVIANSDGERCNDWVNHWQERYIQVDSQRYIAQIQSEWTQFKPESWEAMQAEDLLEFNANASRIDDGLSHTVDRIKCLGNSIVPQIAYLFFEIIKRSNNDQRRTRTIYP